MRFTVIGATGMVGSAVTTEAVRRAHRVTAVSRRPARQPWPTGVTGVSAHADDADAIRELLRDSDAAVVAIRSSAGEESTTIEATTALLDCAAATDTRILVVGGAGPLRTPGAPDVLLVDDPDYVPVAWRDIALTSVAQLRACESHRSGADWAYLSPSAVLEPGVRTGSYRRGTDTALVGPDGTSRISAEDLAVAVLDELERPAALPRAPRHFTVGY